MIMRELEALGKERIKKIYMSNGAHEPLFGVATGDMKPIARKIKINQPLAEQLRKGSRSGRSPKSESIKQVPKRIRFYSKGSR